MTAQARVPAKKCFSCSAFQSGTLSPGDLVTLTRTWSKVPVYDTHDPIAHEARQRCVQTSDASLVIFIGFGPMYDEEFPPMAMVLLHGRLGWLFVGVVWELDA